MVSIVPSFGPSLCSTVTTSSFSASISPTFRRGSQSIRKIFITGSRRGQGRHRFSIALKVGNSMFLMPRSVGGIQTFEVGRASNSFHRFILHQQSARLWILILLIGGWSDGLVRPFPTFISNSDRARPPNLFCTGRRDLIPLFRLCQYLKEQNCKNLSNPFPIHLPICHPRIFGGHQDP